jgi:3-hydroxymyristoyl/3-hydroxydecanoyl-(acyl carrier protein) dehydratase
VDKVLERHDILTLMPHDQQWVMVDRVLDWTAGERIVTEKHVLATDPFVAGHFAHGPAVLPGVLLIEFVGQSAYLLMQLSKDILNNRPNIVQPHMLARCRAQFSSPAVAGDVLTARIDTKETVRGVTVHEGIVMSAERQICSVQIFSAPIAVPADVDDQVV